MFVHAQGKNHYYYSRKKAKGAGPADPHAIRSPTMDLKALGQNLRKCRKEQKLSQEKLAEAVGLSANYIGLIERGEKQPALDTLVNILNALDASADAILAGDLKYIRTRKKSAIEREFKNSVHENVAKIYAVIHEIEKI